MEKSSDLKELATALAIVQGKLQAAKKDSVNPFFKSKYADLTSVWEACRQPLSENGLSVVQTCDQTEHGIVVETMLLHSSGQWVSGKLALKPVKDDPQGIGSAISYARRYSLAALVGITQDDDDAEAIKGKQAPAAKPSKAVAATTAQTGANEDLFPDNFNLDAACKDLAAILHKRGMKDAPSKLNWVHQNVDKEILGFSVMTQEQFAKAFELLNKGG